MKSIRRVQVLYRFQIELSDIDRNHYESLDFRIAQHPSETATYLLSRVLAYILSYDEKLEFSAEGLNDPEAPTLKIKNSQDGVQLWIEIGNPSAKKLHKACKVADVVKIYTYKSTQVLIDDIKKNEVHRADKIQIFFLDPKILAVLEKDLEKNNRWTILIQENRLDISFGPNSVATEITKFLVN